jgi:SsrA-binding protein
VSQKKSQSGQSSADALDRVVARNRRARHDYEILDSIDCGVVLVGSEVKSIRDNRISIEEAYAKIEQGELWLLNCDIAEYPQANVMNHEPRRRRKLLLKKSELRKFAENAEHQGFTLIPLEMFFRRGIVKVKVGVAKGRKHHDKREELRKDAAGKAIREAMKHRV